MGNHLKFKEKLQLTDFIEPLLQKEGEFYRYVPGYTDVRVAKEFSKVIGKTITKFVVLHARIAKFGEMREHPPKTNNNNKTVSELTKRIEMLEAKFDRFAKDLGYDIAAE